MSGARWPWGCTRLRAERPSHSPASWAPCWASGAGGFPSLSSFPLQDRVNFVCLARGWSSLRGAGTQQGVQERACWPLLDLQPLAVQGRDLAPSLYSKSANPPVLMSCLRGLGAGAGGARGAGGRGPCGGALVSARPLHSCPGLADTEWLWRVNAETGPTSTA